MKGVSMNSTGFTYRIYPLGDAALTVDFGNKINETINREVIARFNQLRKEPFPGMIEALPAYSSYTVYYDILTVKLSDPSISAFESVKKQVEKRLALAVTYDESSGRLMRIPVCYEHEYAPDIHYLAAEKNIQVEEVIRLHTSKNYKVYMLGFLPGFSYMGEVDDRIAMPRKPQPQAVAAGGVGIAGKQTGIYPLASPGGWQIIGQTPLKLFTVNNEEDPAMLRAGDSVQFFSISKNEFENY
ncbi:MAG: 5-oxoprolinase subunit PxpB [Chitinophagaceae bacterium]